MDGKEEEEMEGKRSSTPQTRNAYGLIVLLLMLNILVMGALV